MSILSWLKGAIQSLFGAKEITEKFGITPPADKSMEEAVKLWAECYRNTPPWVVQDSNIRSLNLPYSISHEIARLVTLEFKSEMSGSPRADFLSDAYSYTINRSPVWVEYACAMGGVFLKPYVSGAGIFTDFIQADAVVVSEYDSAGNISGAVFADRVVIGNKYYTRLESHGLRGTNYAVLNKAYVSDTSEQLGRGIPLDSVPAWADIVPEAHFENIRHPFFVYFGIPGANVIDRRSPLGVSVFNAAVQTIEEADRQFTRSLWEFEGSELAVYADETALRTDDYGNASMPKFNRRLIRSLNFNKDDAFNVFSPEIREQAQANGLNNLLRQIERQCGLAFGTLSDVNDADKTATEIKASKQRSYATVAAIQSRLEKCLTEYAEVLDILCTLYGLAPAGKIEESFDFDDSLVTDSETEQKIWLQEVGAGIMSPVEYRMKRYGETEEQAAQMLPETFDGDT